jgi:hypothetical protein
MAGMYPDNKTLSVFGREVVWPGLDDGRFSNGSFDDPLVPPSFIPAETLNLVLDNLGELVAGLGGTPDHTNPKQVAAAVKGALDALENAVQTKLDTKAPLASPVFTGTPKVPSKTAAAANDGTLIATEAQVKTVADSNALKAPIASPSLTGTPTAPTPGTADSGTRIATTAFTHAAAKLDAWPVGSFYTQYPLSGQSTIANMFPSSGSPATLFGGTWTEMYAGEKVFFMGGLSSVESNRCGGVQEDAIRNITGQFEALPESSDDGGFLRNAYNAHARGKSPTAYPSAQMTNPIRLGDIVYFNAAYVVPTDSTNHPGTGR